ncbi:hypothetical protein FRC07_002511 [Ceratobasidium sp. 392]|nr:hypothetical protein FRC07_002511 [Ceratobasidium sp. 392]
MHPTKPGIPRRNTLTKPSPAAVAAPIIYPPQMTLPGKNYLTSTSAVPTPPKINMQIPPNPPNLGNSQRPYLATEMAMMQESLKIAALKTAETIRYMSTVRRLYNLGCTRTPSHGSSQAKRPPPAVTNELRLQLARYDQLCDIVEARLVRAYAALSARLARERAANPQPAQSNLPIQIDSPMSDDVPLSLSNTAPAAAKSNVQYTAPPKSRGLSSLSAQRPSHTIPDPSRIISPITLASNAAMLPTLDSIPSHHAVVPELLQALRRQEQEQARNALHQAPAQEVTSMDIFGAPHMDDLFMNGTNPTGVDLDINSAVAAIDTSVGGIGPSIDDAVSAIHSAVPDMDSAVAELDSAVAEMAAAGELASSDALFGDLHTHANAGDDGLQSAQLGERFPGEADPFVTGEIPPADGFQRVSGTEEDQAKEDLLANLDAGESNGIDLGMNMDLMEMGGLDIGAGEIGHGGGNAPEGEISGIDIEGGNMGLGDVDIAGGDMSMHDVGIGEMGMGGDEIVAMWSNIDNFFDNMDTDIGDGIHIKTEPE